ncbi:MAG: LacI family DNA-binding transcriptional regulator [Anaerolineae bacterium]|nr:LacI family DNA-binding transcriptional regulator [Anaerolineae bacterium]
MPTQRDIADQLGVSVTTVSLALRGDPQISDEMQSRVRAFAAQIGYDYHPRRHSSSDTTQIAYVAHRDASGVGSFYSAILQGVEQGCSIHGVALYFVLIEDTDSAYNLLSDYDLDGLLLVGAMSAQIVKRFKTLGLPIVLVNNNLPALELDRVLIENEYSVYAAVKHLAAWGHQRIALIYGPLDHTSFYERLSAYHKVMQELQFEEIVLNIQQVDVDTAERAMISHLHNKGVNFSALLTCNDKAAIGAIRALQIYDARVPEDVSVIGFDDIDMARVIQPTLTTLHVYRGLMGETAVQMLLERIENPARPPCAMTISTTFVERESVGPRRA